ncbi:YgaP family membrane protein [Pontibacter sp. MBLB2868]|uniref:YgaP family membrane protein n=1 Tax=Pontibacter sp. MBLB2868 TaxID=3451555 RepID=UPI003F751FB3
MDCNVGVMEQKARVLAGLALVGIGAYYNVKALAALGLIPIATAIVRWCPINAAIGYNGCENSSEETTSHQ